MFRKYYFSITLLILFFVALSATFYRFMVVGDYTVTYEIDCDPNTTSCFVGCEDEDCTENYYYSYMTRQAKVVENLCGEDITDCEAALSCQTGEECYVELCTGENCSRNFEGTNQDFN